jgi:hypothetical protein
MAEMPKRRTAEIRLFCLLTSVFWLGGVAQLGERLLCKQEVIGSIPFTSTMGTSTMGTSTMGTSIMDVRGGVLAKQRTASQSLRGGC